MRKNLYEQLQRMKTLMEVNMEKMRFNQTTADEFIQRIDELIDEINNDPELQGTKRLEYYVDELTVLKERGVVLQPNGRYRFNQRLGYREEKLSPEQIEDLMLDKFNALLDDYKTLHNAEDLHGDEDMDFSKSVVKDIVWRAGVIRQNRSMGGIWFGEKESDVNKFIAEMQRYKRIELDRGRAKPYRINLQRPYVFYSFYDYRDTCEDDFLLDRMAMSLYYQKQGFDGIIIEPSFWFDLADDSVLEGGQYIVFDPKNVKPA